MKYLKLVATTFLMISSLFSGVSRAEIHTIDLLVLHPPKSVLNTDILTRVASMESYANKALENSEAKIRFRVVKIEEIDIANPKTDSATLSALRSSRKAQELRIKYGADLVTMITPTGPYCGVGYVLGGRNDQMYAGHKKYGFNVVADRCISSFAHELGHNLGLGHSAKQGSSGGLYRWGRGHGVQSTFVTTMAYTSAYRASRIQFFSNPDISLCKGLKCGSYGGANAVKAVAVSGSQISEWFESIEVIDNTNQAPNANEDYAVTRSNEAIEIAVLENDVDPEQDIIVIDSVGEAKHGAVFFVDGLITYIPEQEFVGQDNFQYTINDGHDHLVSTIVTVNVGWGVNYQYFQGHWGSLPDFNHSSVLEEGISHNFSLEQRLRDHNFGFKFFAQIEIPATGEYQFFLTSDDGSKLLIDERVIVDNGALQGGLTESGLVYLDAGLHQIEVHFFQADGGQQLNVEWQGPGFVRQIISSSAFRLAEPENSFPVATDDKVITKQNTEISIDVLKNDIDTDGDQIHVVSWGEAEHGVVDLQGNKLIYQPDSRFSGTDSISYVISDGRGGEDTGLVTIIVGQSVSYEYFEGVWDSLPDFDSLTPISSGTQKDFRLKNRERNDNFAFRFRSELNVPKEGRYTFYLISDDGSKLFIDGELVINNDGLHGRRWRRGRIELTDGTHDIEVQYFEKTGRERLKMYWRGPKMRFQKVSSRHLQPIQ